MKQKLLSLFLAFSLLLTMILPVAAADASPILETEQDPHLLYAQEGSHRSKRAWGEIGQESLIEVAPASKNTAVKIPQKATLHFFLLANGSTDTYWCIELYRKDRAEPLAVMADLFPGEAGIYSYSITLKTEGLPLGSYSIRVYSASSQGDSLAPIEGTQSETTLLLTDWIKPITEVSLVDPISRKELQYLSLAPGQIGYVEIVELPSFNTATPNYYLEHNSRISAEEQSGMLFITPKSYGWSELRLKTGGNEQKTSLEVQICIHSEGHINMEETVLNPPGPSDMGATLQCCPDCGATRIIYEDSYLTVFNRFADVPEEQWYYEGVREAVLLGLFNGVSPHHFGPDGQMTRAMLVTVLWRYAGAPAAGSSPFRDVPEGQWFSEAISWAAAQGVVSGIGDRRFDPDGYVTREQLATILYRYGKADGLALSGEAEALSTFPDAAEVSSYATEAMGWAVEAGIVTGSREGSKTLLLPQGNATRAQVAVITARFIEKYYAKESTADTLPGYSNALEYGTANNCNWAFYEDGTLMVTGERISGIEAEGKAPWSHLSDRITRLNVWEGFVSIGANAFSGLSQLKEVSLPDSLREISSKAFANCSSLEEIVIPEGTTYLIGAVFQGCSALRKVSLPNSIRPEVYYSGSACSTDYMFSGCTALESITLPPGIQRIGEGMFQNCSSLKEIILPDGVLRIEKNAFRNCSSLEVLILPGYLKILEDKAFPGCTSLEALVFPGPWADVENREEATAPFGDRGLTVVYAYSGTAIAILAAKMGYQVIPLESLIE